MNAFKATMRLPVATNVCPCAAAQLPSA